MDQIQIVWTELYTILINSEEYNDIDRLMFLIERLVAILSRYNFPNYCDFWEPNEDIEFILRNNMLYSLVSFCVQSGHEELIHKNLLRILSILLKNYPFSLLLYPAIHQAILYFIQHVILFREEEYCKFFIVFLEKLSEKICSYPPLWNIFGQVLCECLMRVVNDEPIYSFGSREIVLRLVEVFDTHFDSLNELFLTKFKTIDDDKWFDWLLFIDNYLQRACNSGVNHHFGYLLKQKINNLWKKEPEISIKILESVFSAEIILPIAKEVILHNGWHVDNLVSKIDIQEERFLLPFMTMCLFHQPIVDCLFHHETKTSIQKLKISETYDNFKANLLSADRLFYQFSQGNINQSLLNRLYKYHIDFLREKANTLPNNPGNEIPVLASLYTRSIEALNSSFWMTKRKFAFDLLYFCISFYENQFYLDKVNKYTENLLITLKNLIEKMPRDLNDKLIYGLRHRSIDMGNRKKLMDPFLIINQIQVSNENEEMGLKYLMLKHVLLRVISCLQVNFLGSSYNIIF